MAKLCTCQGARGPDLSHASALGILEMSRKLEKQLACRKCKRVIPWAACNQAGLSLCRKCNVRGRVDVFPALFKPPVKGKAAEALLSEDDASCFFHEIKKAEHVCDACGRFLCQLCSIELNDITTCAGCLESGRKSGDKVELMSRSKRADVTAFSLSIVTVLLSGVAILVGLFDEGSSARVGASIWAGFACLTGGSAIYNVRRFRKKPISLTPVGPWRFRAALFLSSVSLGAALLWVLFLFLGDVVS